MSKQNKVVLLLCLILGCHHAYGYVDPGSGGFILQLLAGLLSGLAFSLRTRILDLLKKGFFRKQSFQSVLNPGEEKSQGI